MTGSLAAHQEKYESTEVDTLSLLRDIRVARMEERGVPHPKVFHLDIKASTKDVINEETLTSLSRVHTYETIRDI